MVGSPAALYVGTTASVVYRCNLRSSVSSRLGMILTGISQYGLEEVGGVVHLPGRGKGGRLAMAMERAGRADAMTV